MRPQAQRWVERADEDLRGAQVALDEALYPLCSFLCQQAVEKFLKAIWIERLGTEPPRTHNLANLADDLGLTLTEWDDFLRALSSQAVISRYPLDEPYERDETASRLERTVELCEVLRRLLS
jgi:HEPN domain-containing protein